MFHPLITPLTTYMYTTDIQDGGTVSATDEERLPPGGFSLRHGFPDWFGRATRRSRQVSSQSQTQTPLSTPPRPVGRSASAAGSTPGSAASSAASDALASHARRRDVSTFEVLRYIRSTFDDEDVLDSVPLEAAGNPGAWHAWRTHRKQVASLGAVTGTATGAGIGAGKALPPEPGAKGGGVGAARKPGEWNWDGVWEERVKRGIATSLSEGVLYGNAVAADEVVSLGLLTLPYPLLLRTGR